MTSRQELRIDITEELRSRFFAKVDATPGHGPRGDCHHWTASTHAPGGYGAFGCRASSLSGKVVSAHRVAWIIANNRSIPAGFLIRHLCDNKQCVNPAHLELSDASQNRKDACAAGHVRKCKSFELPTSELNRLIEEYQSGKSQKQLVREWNIPATCLNRLLSKHGVLRPRGAA